MPEVTEQPANQPPGTKRSKSMRGFYIIALGLLVLVGVLCWFVAFRGQYPL